MKMLVNGESNSTVSCLDRGLQFGDGLFETIAVRVGEIMHWPRHWQRLLLGCERLYIPPPNQTELFTEISSLIAPKQNQVIKVIYTRGQSSRGYAFTELESNRIVLQFSWPLFDEANYEQGIDIFQCETRLAHQPLLAGLKHLNRLENVLARHEWSDAQFAEGIIKDIKGCVVEGTMSNVFLVKDNKLITPDLTQCGVAGITRQRIIEIAQENQITIHIGAVTEELLFDADEMFVCNSIIGVWPVRKMADKRFDTRRHSNPVTRLLQKRVNP